MTADDSGPAGGWRVAWGDAAAGLLDALPAAVFAVDACGALTAWNSAAERLWGDRPSPGTAGHADAWRRPDGRALAPGAAFAGRRVLVVEDEPLVALDVEAMLADAGSIVVGPAASVAQAMALVAAEAMDAALLDANVGGASVEAVADALVVRGVPFAFASGFGREALPAEHRGAPLLAKPVAEAELLAVVAGLVAAGQG